MRVAIFTDNDFAKVNGVTTTLRAVLDHAPAGISPRIYTASPLGRNDPQYLSLSSVGMPIPFYGEMRMYVPRLRRYLQHARRDRIDIVHLTTPGPIGLAALYVAQRLRLPLVGSFHTDLAAYTALLSGSARLGALMREYMRWPYGRCARVLVPSVATRNLLVGAKGDPAKIRIWTRGVDAERFSPARRSRRLRDSWHVDDRRPALLYVGRVSREKGLDLLAPLQHRLHAIGIQHRFIIAGEGPMLPALRAALPDAVFTGVLSREAVATAFASADLFVFPSRTDTAGNVVLEAQASGLPVVVSSAGGPRENMMSGLTGVTCDTAGVGEWTAAIASILRTPGRRAAMAAAAREYALTRCWDEALRPLYRAYEEVLTAGAAHPAVRPAPPDAAAPPIKA
jgi:glycosyltransferase involved in cell wall biosynthesis